MNSTDIHFDAIKDAITRFSKLITDFAQMLKNFVASWKKVPAAANGDVTVPNVD